MTAWVLAIVLGVYGVVSVATFVAYWVDKRAARRGDRRVPEKTLHTFELLGGWPGAMVAQEQLRHKTIDPGFRRVFWVIVTIHVLAWGAALYLWLR